jgi:hypothetical protein
MTRAFAGSSVQIDEARTFPKFGADPMGNIVHGKSANPLFGTNSTFNDVVKVLEIFSGCENIRGSLKIALGSFKHRTRDAALVWMTL